GGRVSALTWKREGADWILLMDRRCSASLTCSGVICLFSVTFETLSSALTADSRPSNHIARRRMQDYGIIRVTDFLTLLVELLVHAQFAELFMNPPSIAVAVQEGLVDNEEILVLFVPVDQRFGVVERKERDVTRPRILGHVGQDGEAPSGQQL